MTAIRAAKVMGLSVAGVDILRTQFGPLVVSCLVSTIIVLLVVAYCSHYIHGERGVVTDKAEKEND